MTLFTQIPQRVLTAFTSTSDEERINILYRDIQNRDLCKAEFLQEFWASQVRLAAGFEQNVLGNETLWFERMVGWWFYRSAPQRNQQEMQKYPQKLEMAVILGNYPAAVAWVKWFKQYPTQHCTIEFASKVATFLDKCFSDFLTPGYLLAAEVYQILAQRLEANGALVRDVENYSIHALRNLSIANALISVSEDSIYNASNGQPETYPELHRDTENQIMNRINKFLTPTTIAAETIYAEALGQTLKNNLLAGNEPATSILAASAA